MQSLQVEGRTHQAPFAGDGYQTAQRELSEVQDLLDDANGRFDGALAQAVDGAAHRGLQAVSHLDPRRGVAGAMAASPRSQ